MSRKLIFSDHLSTQSSLGTTKVEMDTPAVLTPSHQLPNTWVLWYHDTLCDDWSLKSYQRICEFDTIEKFWTVYNNLPSIVNSMFFLMKKGYPPVWEAEENIKGGASLFKFPKKMGDCYWTKFSVHLIAGSLLPNQMDELIGINISGKNKSFHVTIAVWNHTSETYLQAIQKSKYPDELVRDQPLYKEFQNPKVVKKLDEILPELIPITQQQTTEKAQQPTKYTYQEIYQLNDPKLSVNLDFTLVSFLNNLPSFQITREMRIHFPNKLNHHFNRRRQRPKSILSNDPIVVKKLRSCFSKISDQNSEKMITEIIEICKAQEYEWHDLAEHFYCNIIENIFLVPIFVQMLIKVEKDFSQLIRNLHHLILNQVTNPREFKDSLLEEGTLKAKRWQISNALLIIELHHQHKYSQEFLNQQLKFWIESVSPENLIPLEILVKATDKMSKSQILIPPDLTQRLSAISQDKKYPTRLRLLLTLPKSCLNK